MTGRDLFTNNPPREGDSVGAGRGTSPVPAPSQKREPAPTAPSTLSASRARALRGRDSPRFGRISDEQQARIDASERELEARRAAAGFVPILEMRRPADGSAEVNCASCNHLGDFNDEHRRGWCMVLRGSRSTWHPVLCAAFVPLTRERRAKVLWQGIVYE